METNVTADQVPAQLAGDLLEGAGAIAEYLFGSTELRRKIYYLAQKSKLPVFRLGGVLCARKSILMTFICGQERPFFESLEKDEGEALKDAPVSTDDIR